MRCLALLTAVAGCGFQGPFGASPISDGPVADVLARDGDASVDPDAAASNDAHPADAALHDAAMMLDAFNPWPCGPQPASPATTVTFGGATTGMSISMIGIAGVQRYVATPGEVVAMKFRYTLHDTACSDCIDQIEYGLVGGAVSKRIGCVFDQGVQSQVQTGSIDQPVTLPSVPGQYDMRLAQAQDFACNDTPSWYSGNPPAAAATIAIICVH